MNKIIAFIALIALLSGLINAGIGNNVSAAVIEEDVIRRLGTLGIMVGDDKGFRPGDTISRAEFAATVVKMMGMKNTAETSGPTTVFSDVYGQWYAGYVQTAYNLGIVSGIGDGSFGPDREVAYEQAVKMIVCALGYEPAAKQKGTYPIGYMVVAAEEEITKDTDGEMGKAATRATIGKLVDNSLDIPMMVQSSYGKKLMYVRSGSSGTIKETLLNNRLKVENYKAFIEKVDGSRVYARITDDEIPVGYQYENNQKVSLTLPEGMAANNLENTLVTIDAKDGMIYSVKMESEILYDYLEEMNGKDIRESFAYKFSQGAGDDEIVKDIKLKISGETYDVDLKNTGFRIMKDGMEYDEANVLQVKNSDMGMFGKFIADKGNIVAIELYTLTEGGLLDNIDGTTMALTYTKGSEKDKSIAELDEADSLQVIVDGKAASFDALAPDMLFDYWQKDKDYIIIASGSQKSGVVSGVGDDFIQIEQKSFDKKEKLDLDKQWYVSTDYGVKYKVESKLEDLLDLKAEVYCDLKGAARYIKAKTMTSSEDFIGVIVNAGTKGGNYLKIYREYNGEGKEVTYSLRLSKDSQLKFDHVASNASKVDGTGIYKFSVNAQQEIETITQMSLLDGNTSADGIQPNFYGGSTGYSAYGLETLKEFNKDNNYTKISPVKVNDPVKGTYTAVKDIFVSMKDTMIFNLVDANGKFQPSLVKYLDIAGKRREGVVMQLEASQPAQYAAITSGGSYIVPATDYYGMVTDKSKISKDKYQLTIAYSYNGLKTKSYTVDKQVIREKYVTSGNTPKEAEVNDIVWFSENGTVTVVGTDGQEDQISGDGSANIFKVYDLSLAQWISTGFTGGSLTDKVYDYVYKADTNVNMIRIFEADEYKDIVVNTKAGVCDALVVQVSEDRQEFKIRKLTDIKEGDRVWCLARSGIARVICFSKKK